MTVVDSTRRISLISLNILLNSLGMRRQRKIFAVGYAKAATTSLHALFTSLGLSSYHGVQWRSCDKLWLLKAFDCFSDGIPRDLAKLDKLFPEAKFILQVRDLDSWVYSRLGHIERHKKKFQNYRTSVDWDTTERAVESWIENRNRHHLFVLDYFAQRPSDLLVVNFIRDATAGTKVANFLGYDGNIDRPVQNVNPEKKTPELHVGMLSSCAARMHISESELKYDVYCPSLLKPGYSPTHVPDTSVSYQEFTLVQ